MIDPTDLSELTLVDAMLRHVAAHPDKMAYVTAAPQGDARMSWAQFEAATNRVANRLAELGVGRGDRVACLTRHHTPTIVLTMAACKLGAVCMPVNWRLAAGEIEYIVNHGEARLLMADEAFLPVIAQAQLPAVRLTLCTEGPQGPIEGFDRWCEGASEAFSPVDITPDDAALQLYSSGTTGLPKGVVLTHRGLVNTSEVVSTLWKVGPDDTVGNPLPTFHVAGMTMLLLTMYVGGTTVAYSDFDPDAFGSNIARHHVTHAFLVPAMLLFMLQVPAARGRDYSCLKLIAYGGSPISDTVLRQAIEVFGCDFLQVYGLTEVSGPATFLMPQDHRDAATRPELLRSAGKPVGGARLRIVDPATGRDVPEGQTGEVWIETVRNLKEYWRNPQATEQVFPEGRNDHGGWFRSGDGGYLRDGYLYIHDRIKDMIVSGGENIYPAEIENVLMTHPAVADGAIIGVPDDRWGESVKACVVLRPGMSASAAEIIDYLRGRLAHYKCPKSVDFVEALPRNPSGKVLKRILREPYWQGRDRAVN